MRLHQRSHFKAVFLEDLQLSYSKYYRKDPETWKQMASTLTPIDKNEMKEDQKPPSYNLNNDPFTTGSSTPPKRKMCGKIKTTKTTTTTTQLRPTYYHLRSKSGTKWELAGKLDRKSRNRFCTKPKKSPGDSNTCNDNIIKTQRDISLSTSSSSSLSSSLIGPSSSSFKSSVSSASLFTKIAHSRIQGPKRSHEREIEQSDFNGLKKLVPSLNWTEKSTKVDHVEILNKAVDYIQKLHHKIHKKFSSAQDKEKAELFLTSRLQYHRELLQSQDRPSHE